MDNFFNNFYWMKICRSYDINKLLKLTWRLGSPPYIEYTYGISVGLGLEIRIGLIITTCHAFCVSFLLNNLGTEKKFYAKNSICHTFCVT